MLCVIYKSKKCDQTYLYVEKKDDFSRVPEALLSKFGRPQFLMMLMLDEQRKLANASPEKVKSALRDTGYYLQVPPPVTSLLQSVTHRDN